MVEVTHDARKVYVDGVAVGEITHPKAIPEEVSLAVFEPTEHARTLGLDLPQMSALMPAHEEPILATVVEMVERQLVCLAAGKPLSEESRNPLHPDLQIYQQDGSHFPVLRHPLVYAVPYTPQMAHHYNARYRVVKAAADQALAEGNYAQYIAFHERPYRLDAFYDICTELAGSDYWESLSWVWTDSENINQNHDQWRELWDSAEPDRNAVMDDDERMALAALPETFTVYRGSDRLDNLENGLSWTLDRDKAHWFARRFARTGAPFYVASATVSKKHVLAHFLSRNEAEIVVDPNDLETVEVHTVSPHTGAQASP